MGVILKVWDEDRKEMLDATEKKEGYSYTEIKTIDNRDKYTKELARCSIQDYEKYEKYLKKINAAVHSDSINVKLIKRHQEVTQTIMDYHNLFWWDGILFPSKGKSVKKTLTNTVIDRIKRFCKDYNETLNWAPWLTIGITVYIVIQVIIAVLSFLGMVK